MPNSEWERISRAYQNNGQLLSTTVTVAGSTLAYYTHYDSAGRPALINDSSTGTGSVEYWKVDPSSGYDSLGRLASAFTDNESVRTAGSFDSNSSNMMTSYSVQLANAPATRFVDAGSPTYLGSKLHTFQDVKAQTTFTFDYDRAGRLRHANATGTASNALAQNYDRQYSFFVGATKDNIATLNSQSSSPSLGNLTYLSNESTLSGTLVSDKTYTYDPINTEQVRATYYPNPTTQQEAVANDAGTGVVTWKTNPNCNTPMLFYYDAQDRLTLIWNGGPEDTLAYDATGALARRILQSESRYHLGQDATIKVSGSTTTAKLHVLLGGTRIASAQGAAVTYYHRDHMGSVIATSTGGAVAGSVYRYDLYGKSVVSNEVSGAESEIGYTGGLKLSEGLVALGARVYDPALRQFLQPDNVDSRRYGYVRGDPANRIDPTGHEYESSESFWARHSSYYGMDAADYRGSFDNSTSIWNGGGGADASGDPMLRGISVFLRATQIQKNYEDSGVANIGVSIDSFVTAALANPGVSVGAELLAANQAGHAYVYALYLASPEGQAREAARTGVSLDEAGLVAWSVYVGGFWGLGVGVNFGSDNGQGFIRLQPGVGLGGGVSFMPTGSFPVSCRGDCTRSGMFGVQGSVSLSAVVVQAGAGVGGAVGLRQDADARLTATGVNTSGFDWAFGWSGIEAQVSGTLDIGWTWKR